MNYSEIKPLYDKILVKRISSENKTPGGLIIPAASKEKDQTGEVIKVGHGRLLTDGNIVPLRVQPGDIIFFGKYAGQEVNEEYLIIREEEIIGII